MKTLVRGIRTIAHGIGIDVVRYRDPADALPEDLDAAATAIWQQVREYTMTSPVRVSALCEAVRYIVRAGIPGDIMECGVWKGGSMMAAALQLQKVGVNDRQLYLFDTFEGMPPPTSADVSTHGVAATEIFGQAGHQSTGLKQPWEASSLEDVRKVLLSTGYPAANIHLVKGKVEDTVPRAAPQKLALLRLDTDWYESTRHEMTHLFPRLASGGVLLIDDYGYWQGSRKAVDEYIEEHRVRILLCRLDESARIAVVP
jgi:O-methyltransferase